MLYGVDDDGSDDDERAMLSDINNCKRTGHAERNRIQYDHSQRSLISMCTRNECRTNAHQ